MLWPLINVLAFAGTPVGMLFGWLTYIRLPDKNSWRARLALAALLLASTSVACLLAYLTTHLNAGGEQALRLGMYAAVAGAVFSFSTKPRLILPSLLANIGSLMLWFGLTRP